MNVKELGVQSYCFRGFKDNAKVAQLVRDIGVEVIELCAVHIDFDNVSQHEPVIATYRDAGVRIASIGVQGFNANKDHERNWFEFASKAGAKFISAHFHIDNWQEATKVAAELGKEYGIRVAIHNHGGQHWLGNSETLRHILAHTDKQIGICMDTAWAIDSRENPLKWIEQFGDRIYGLHVKDMVYDRARNPEDVVIGKGNLDLPGLIKACDAHHFAGYCVIEYEGDVNDPVPALKECVEQFHAAGK